MANPEHLAKLMEGVDAWNKWRKGNEMSAVDLSQLNLSKKDFSGADFNFANLFGCVCIETNFTGADFHNANLTLMVAAKPSSNTAKLVGRETPPSGYRLNTKTNTTKLRILECVCIQAAQVRRTLAGVDEKCRDMEF